MIFYKIKQLIENHIKNNDKKELIKIILIFFLFILILILYLYILIKILYLLNPEITNIKFLNLHLEPPKEKINDIETFTNITNKGLKIYQQNHQLTVKKYSFDNETTFLDSDISSNTRCRIGVACLVIGLVIIIIIQTSSTGGGAAGNPPIEPCYLLAIFEQESQ